LTEDTQKIQLYREHTKYHVLDAKTVEITRHFYMFVSPETPVWVYPMDGYVANLTITNGDKNSLPVLSPKELSYALRNETKKELNTVDENTLTQEKLKNIWIKQNMAEAKQLGISNKLKNKYFVGIMLPQRPVESLQEVIVKWITPVEKLKEKSKYILDLEVGMEHEIPPTDTASMYFSITTDDDKKYEIVGNATILADDENCNKKDPKKGDDYRELLKTKIHHAYRVKRDSKTTFTIQWQIGIPKLVRNWAWCGFLLGISVLSYSGYTFFQDQSLFVLNSTLVSGFVALIIGFRVMLFHDTELMRRWNRLYLALLVISIGAIIAMAYLRK